MYNDPIFNEGLASLAEVVSISQGAGIFFTDFDRGNFQ
jgi:hypothetical protein